MWAALVTFVLGASGWGFTWLLFEPTKEIMNLRREAQEYLIFHGNLEKKDVPPEERRTASDAFRRIGAGLVSRYAAAYRWVRPIWLWLGWNIHCAGATLISLSNSIQFDGCNLTDCPEDVARIRRYLNLPTPDTLPAVPTT
jgi:hypothetical protein